MDNNVYSVKLKFKIYLNWVGYKKCFC